MEGLCNTQVRHVADTTACLIVVQHDEFLTSAYYNCESKIFKWLSIVSLTRTRRCSWRSGAARGRAAPEHRPDNMPPARAGRLSRAR